MVSIPELKRFVVVLIFLAGLKFNKDTMCTVLNEAGIQTSDWAKIAKNLPASTQLQISASEFIKGWQTYADQFKPSWIKLAEILETGGIPKYKEAAGKLRMNQGTIVMR